MGLTAVGREMQPQMNADRKEQIGRNGNGIVARASSFHSIAWQQLAFIWVHLRSSAVLFNF